MLGGADADGVPMESDGVGKRNCDAHPVPSVFLVFRRLVPISHEKQRLNKDESVGLVIEVIEDLQP